MSVRASKERILTALGVVVFAFMVGGAFQIWAVQSKSLR